MRLITSQDQQALGVFEKHRPPRQSSGTLLSDLFSEPSGQFVVKLGVVTAFLMLLVGIMDQSWILALIGGASLLLAGYLSLKEHRHLSASSDVEHPLPMTLMTVPSGKFHAKMYIVDQSVAYVGSANLTRASMYGKRERIEVKSLSDEAREEERAFSDLWEMEDWESDSFEEVSFFPRVIGSLG